MSGQDTITAITTPPGEGGVGIIRVSGPGAHDISRKVFRPSGSMEGLKERYLHYGSIIDPAADREIDNGFLVLMNGPRSYTGEDVSEFHCHGGALVLKSVLQALMDAGARLAEPGEFTKRAFLNGKLDLLQAESVIDVIRAQTEASLEAARGRLSGALSARVNEAKEVLVDLLMRVEAELDFTEDEVEGMPAPDFLAALDDAKGMVKDLLSTYEEGKALRDGTRVLILGRPNVGKSSLLNLLLRQERAIVTPLPGTTRDVIEETVNLRGLPIRLMDTAGLRDTEDFVESIGVRLARQRIEGADIVLFVIDVTVDDFSGDLSLLDTITGKKIIIIANKTDLAAREKEVEKAFSGKKVCFISALCSMGMEELKDAIYEEAVGHPFSNRGEARPGELLVSLRHREALVKALEGIHRTVEAVEAGYARELAATDLRWAVDRLGEITGETTTEDILEKIFSEFCIGK